MTEKQPPEQIWLDSIDCCRDDLGSGTYYTGKPSIASISYARVHPVDEGRVEGARQRLRAFIKGDKFALSAQHVSNTEKDRDITGDVEAVLSVLPQLSSSEPQPHLTGEVAEALHDDVVAAITDMQEGRKSHVQWAAHLRNTNRHDCVGCTDHAAHIGEASYHDEWIEKYDRVIRLLALVPIATAPIESSERRCAKCGHHNLINGVCAEEGSRMGHYLPCGCKCVFPATEAKRDESRRNPCVHSAIVPAPKGHTVECRVWTDPNAACTCIESDTPTSAATAEIDRLTSELKAVQERAASEISELAVAVTDLKFELHNAGFEIEQFNSEVGRLRNQRDSARANAINEAIGAVNGEKLHENLDHESDKGYALAITHCIAALESLKQKESSFQK
jgi:hypothetical protein